jgi:hypothetical protein
LFPLGFAAPELILNKLEIADHRTDLFALGITLWYLFTERLPLSHPNPSIFTNLQLTHPLPDSDLLPNGLYPILRKMTQKHTFRTAPNLMTADDVMSGLMDGMVQRYQSLEEVIADLQAISVRKTFFGF